VTERTCGKVGVCCAMCMCDGSSMARRSPRADFWTRLGARLATRDQPTCDVICAHIAIIFCLWPPVSAAAQADTIRQFRQSLTPTYTGVSSSPRLNLATNYLSTASCPFDTRPTEAAQGTLSTANKHVPGMQDTTTWNRYFWIIQYAVGQVRGPCVRGPCVGV
jgi:hypothetical protein